MMLPPPLHLGHQLGRVGRATAPLEAPAGTVTTPGACHSAAQHCVLGFYNFPFSFKIPKIVVTFKISRNGIQLRKMWNKFLWNPQG
jgi:hypothetical protein